MKVALRDGELGGFSAEFRLMAGLLRWGLGTGGLEVGDLERLDWDRFERLLRRHRLVMPVYRALELAGETLAVPAAARARLAGANRATALRQMRVARDLLEVARAFEAAGARYVSLKGPALSQFLFGDAVARECADLDFVVSEGDFGVAVGALASLGYERQAEPSDAVAEPEEGVAPRLGYHGHYRKGERVVELHWRVSGVDFAFPASVETVLERRRFVEVGGHSVALLGEADLADYLSLHGAAHCWNRLKWLYDLARLAVASEGGGLGEGLGGTRAELGRIRDWRAALLQAVFAVEEGGRAGSFSLRTRALRWLGLRQLREETGDSSLAGNAARRSVALALGVAGMGAKWRYLAGILAWPEAMRRYPLAAGWRWLYLVIGPVYWVAVRIGVAKRGAG